MTPEPPPTDRAAGSGDAVPLSGWGLARVTGASMSPTLEHGDLLVVRWGAATVLGRIVVVRLPGGRPVAVKRLVARSGEGWWVERDNPSHGVDSWAVGQLADADVLGGVVARLWPRPRLLPPRPR